MKLASLALMSPLFEASMYKLLPIIFALRFPRLVNAISPVVFPDDSVIPIVNSPTGSFQPIKAF